MSTSSLTDPRDLLPINAESSVLVGRIFDPEAGGPCLVMVDDGDLVDITTAGPTMSRLMEYEDASVRVRDAARTGRRWRLDHIDREFSGGTSSASPRLLSPIDLQVIKAAGVTFVESMLERVVEERVHGDRAAAHRIRGQLADIIGGQLASVQPGSQQAEQVKALLVDEGLWSQYLEVGIGPYPEVFTKAPVLSSVGALAQIGIRSDSTWNNPEPEVVLVVNSRGQIVGATLGNDVNLRDIEGRSALLLGTAKDNNASCALGPFIRLIGEDFSLDDIRALDVLLEVHGRDGFSMEGHSSMKNISRDPVSLTSFVVGPNHQYPDGFALLTGTLFAPTQDRFESHNGFTHAEGDVVRISSSKLGCLINEVTYSHKAAAWDFGLWRLMDNLSRRGLLADS